MEEIRYCPDCITEMIKDNRKLGKDSKFFVCPSCGIREQQDEEQDNAIIKEKKNDTDNDYSEDDAISQLLQQKGISS